MWTRLFVIASLVALSACSDSDAGGSQQTDDGSIFTAPADTDTLSENQTVRSTEPTNQKSIGSFPPRFNPIALTRRL